MFFNSAVKVATFFDMKKQLFFSNKYGVEYQKSIDILLKFKTLSPKCPLKSLTVKW
jgi:hypothetical protein